MRNVRTFAIVTAVCLLVAGGVFAQSSRGGIQGQVVDGAGSALPGVSITISSPALQGTRTAVTGSNGEFRFPLLPTGTYSVTLSMPGFQATEYTDIRVGLERTVTLEVEMEPAFTEEVVVTSEAPLVDVTSTTVGTEIGEEALENLPVGRDFRSVTYLATGAVDGGNAANAGLRGSAAIMGASALENRYVVDELDTTDPAYGTVGTVVSTSFIEELQVKTGGYEAEHGGALGGVVNMITKSGGNDFSGAVFGYFTNDSLWDDPEIPGGRGDTVAIPDTDYDVGFTLGGKLIEDKLWYFAGYNPRFYDYEVVSQVGTVQTNTLPVELERHQYSGKLTFQIDESNLLEGSVLGDPTDFTGEYYSADFVNLPGYPQTDLTYDNYEQGGLNYGLSWDSIFSENMFLEVSAGRHESGEEYSPSIDVPSWSDPAGYFTGIDESVFWGGAGFQQIKDDRSRDQVRAAFTWFLGEAHELKAGASHNAVEFDMNYDVVGSSDAFCAPVSAADGGVWTNQGFIDTNCTTSGGAPGVTMDARVGNRWRMRSWGYYNANYKNQSTGETDETALYLQDAWRVLDNLTVNVGVRAESMEVTGDQSGEIDPTTGLTKTLDFDFSDMIAPRFGVIWDPMDNGRSKVFGHYGKFYQSVPLDINVRAFGDESYDLYYYSYPDSGLPSTTNPGTLTYVYYLGHALVDPDIDPQYMEEYVFGGEYQISDTIALGAKYIDRSLGEVIEDISVDNATTYFITNPGATYTVNPATGQPLDEPVDFPSATRDFEGIELTAHRRMTDNWQVYASLLWSELVGNYEGLYSRDNRQIDPNITSKFDLPDLLDNAYGTLQNDREWQFKIFGNYVFPFGLTTGVNFFWMDGNPISKLGAHDLYGLDERFVTPRGTEGRTEDWTNLDLHFGMPFDIGDLQLEALLDVFNVLDEQIGIEVDQRWTTEGGGSVDQTNLNWGEPLVYNPPRNVRVGVRLQF